jgi:hypothetical protein
MVLPLKEGVENESALAGIVLRRPRQGATNFRSKSKIWGDNVRPRSVHRTKSHHMLDLRYMLTLPVLRLCDCFQVECC